MEKQTAVEWLIEQIRNEKYIEDIDFKQAKEMEKQQIIDAFNEDNSEFQDWKSVSLSGEQYYNETFNK